MRETERSKKRRGGGGGSGKGSLGQHRRVEAGRTAQETAAASHGPETSPQGRFITV